MTYHSVSKTSRYSSHDVPHSNKTVYVKTTVITHTCMDCGKEEKETYSDRDGYGYGSRSDCSNSIF